MTLVYEDACAAGGLAHPLAHLGRIGLEATRRDAARQDAVDCFARCQRVLVHLTSSCTHEAHIADEKPSRFAAKCPPLLARPEGLELPTL